MSLYSYPSSLIPDNDDERLQTLYQCEVLDTAEEESFDRVASMARLIFNTASSFVNFVDAEEVFFKSNLSNFPTRTVERKHSLCSLTVLSNKPTVFEDTHTVPELLKSPYVAADGGIRFYAGAPLIMPNGHRIGSVCVIDPEARLVTKRQMDMLVMLAAIIVEKLVQQIEINRLEAEISAYK